jgi:hypothetical protein
MATDLTTSDATGRLARYVLGTRLKDLPTEVRVEARGIRRSMRSRRRLARSPARRRRR